jgi:hypothetical protein
MKLGLTASLILIVAAMAYASPINTLGIGSSGFVQATLTSINWTPDSAALPVPGPPWNGDVNSATDLIFAGGPLLSQEGVLINNGQPFGSPPPPTATVFNPFLQFEVHTNLLYFLTAVGAGSSNNDCSTVTATGQSCSLMVGGSTSPVILTKNGTSTVVSINMSGFATDGTPGNSPWTGGFSATIPSITPLQIEEFFCGVDHVCSAADVAAAKVLDVKSVSGSFFASSPSGPPPPVPEPGTMWMILGGAVFTAVGAIRRKRNSSV